MLYVITKNHYRELQDSEYVVPLLQKIKSLRTEQECEFTNYLGMDNYYEKIYNLYQCSHNNKIEAFILALSENYGFFEDNIEYSPEIKFEIYKNKILKTITENIQYYVYRVNPREKITYEIKKKYRNAYYEYEKKRLELFHYIDNLVYEIEYLITSIVLYILFLCKILAFFYFYCKILV